MHVHVLSIIVIFFCSIVQAFDNIVESLMEFKKFTNISVNGDDLLLRGERVSKTFYIDYIQMSCNIIVSMQIFRNQYKGRTFSVSAIQGNCYKSVTSTCMHSKIFDYCLELNASTTDTSMDEPAAETSSLSLPQNLAKFLPTGPGQDIKMAFTFYREPNLFPIREKQMDEDQSIVGSPIIGATVSGLPNGTGLDPPLQVTLVLTHAPTPSEFENTTRRCAFWDFTGNGIIPIINAAVFVSMYVAIASA